MFNIPGKIKDGLQAMHDLEQMSIHPELAPQAVKRQTFIPPTCFCQSLSKTKVLEDYSSNIKNLVSIDSLKLSRMKSHDCQVLMQ